MIRRIAAGGALSALIFMATVIIIARAAFQILADLEEQS